jgi:uncharacterized SAM-binding protein YcdF (DUF218 family)
MANAEIIVLGRRLTTDGRISGIFRHRLDKALTVYRQQRQEGKTARLIISGGDLGRRGITEAGAGRDYLCAERGVSPADVAVEEKALDTVGNAVYSKKLILASGCRNPSVVSSCYHIPRVSYIFSHVLGPEFEPTYVSAATGLDPEDYRRHWHSESVKMMEVVRFVDGIDAHPGDHEKILIRLREKGLIVEDRVV